METNNKTLRELDLFIRKNKESREVKRALSVKQYLLGIEQKKVAELLTVSQPFVSKWNKVYQDKGINGLKLQHKGSASHISSEERMAVTNWIKQRASLTTKELQKYVKDLCGVRYASSQSYYDLMAQARYSHKKSQKVNPRRDEEQVKKKRKEIKKMLQQLSEEIQSGERKVFF